MLKYKIIEGKVSPIITCDNCNSRIDNAGTSAVVYHTTFPKEGDYEGQVLFAHKGTCLDTLEQKLADRYDGWEELERFLSFLTHNVKLTSENINDTLKFNWETGI